MDFDYDDHCRHSRNRLESCTLTIAECSVCTRTFLCGKFACPGFGLQRKHEIMKNIWIWNAGIFLLLSFKVLDLDFLEFGSVFFPEPMSDPVLVKADSMKSYFTVKSVPF